MGKLLRRTFLIGTGLVAGGLAFGYWSVRKPYDNPILADLKEGEASFSPWLKIDNDGGVTVYTGRAEMGQGISTTLAALVAEELDYPLADIKVEHGPASHAYFNGALLDTSVSEPDHEDTAIGRAMKPVADAAGKVLGMQITGGSTSTRDAYVKMRKAGAAAKVVLMQAAAAKAGVGLEAVEWNKGKISAGGTAYAFGDLLADASAIEPPADPVLKDPSQWTQLGRPQRRTDLEPKVTGAAIFGIDVDLPDMVHGTVRMSPRLGAGVKSADFSGAEKMPGVIKIVRLSTRFGQGFGVIATNTWAAFKAAEAIEVEWEDAPYPADSEAIMTLFSEALADGTNGKAKRDRGNVDIAFADAPIESVIEATYQVPFLAHATMEPMNATAQFADGKMTVWAPNQAPTVMRMVVAAELGIDEEAVAVNTTSMGGGFGRRSETDFGVYAALLAREADGKPVKVTWTREEDMTHDMYRPAAMGQFKARIGGDGLPVAVDMRIAAPSVIGSAAGRVISWLKPPVPDDAVTEGSWNQPYAIENYRVSAIDVPLAIPTGFWRSVGSSYNGFFHECFMDEIAEKSGQDPIAMRLALMADYPVAVKVMEKLREISGAVLPGRARGVAFTLSFGGWVAMAVDVSGSADAIKIENVYAVADVGTALDPVIIRNQIISGAVYGLSSVMGQQITFADGAVEQMNFYDFDALRMNQMPAFEVAILENAEKMGGVGEIGTPPSVAALANAVSRLTGQRVRTLPVAEGLSFA